MLSLPKGYVAGHCFDSSCGEGGKRGSWAAACLQMLTKSNNGAFEETVVRGHCHGSPLAIGPDAGASKLTRA